MNAVTWNSFQSELEKIARSKNVMRQLQRLADTSFSIKRTQAGRRNRTAASYAKHRVRAHDRGKVVGDLLNQGTHHRAIQDQVRYGQEAMESARGALRRTRRLG